VYGHRQRRGAALLAGLGLIVYPYLVNGTFILLVVGLLLTVLPLLLDF
jgi:hypothetical protein